jgi:tetratricopeptide (TPR) repeat protein
MPQKVEAYSVFIASPSGLDDDRTAVRDEIMKFNQTFLHDFSTIFSARGWEDVPGGAHRPQELINGELQRCDYMILILGSRWGSSPAKGNAFTSGTEEEFYLARDCIGRSDSPMTDILVLFKGVPEAQLCDPGKQLRRVIAFKSQLEESKQLLYRTFDDLDDLRGEVSRRLVAWARERRLGEGESAARRLEGAPFQRAINGEAGTVDEVEAGPSALAAAEAYEARGLMTQAEAAYAKAIAGNEIASLEKYARFLRRTGRLSKSLEMNRRILSQLASENVGETIPERARILTNIGITERNQGELRKATYSLHEAVQTARQAWPQAPEALAYALDNLGITYIRAGDNSQAADCFQEALSLRTASGDDAGRAKTLLNLARLHMRAGEVEAARQVCEEAIAVLEPLQDRARLAEAHAAMGEIYYSGEDYVNAESSYRMALQLNRELGRPAKIAITLNQLARALMERGELESAERFAQESLDENDRTSNREGVVSSTHLLGRILGRTRREQMAVGLLEKAVDEYREIGNPSGEAWALMHLADVKRQVGLEGEASQLLARAHGLAVSSGNARLLGSIGRAA